MISTVKIPKTTYPVNEFIRKRWSPRSFANKTIPQETLDQLFEAASWAPSSVNEQPWRYLFAHKGEPAFEKMVACLVPGNQPWAKNAQVLVLTLAKTIFVYNGATLPNKYSFYDSGAANSQLLLEAASHDIYGHLMGGFDHEKTKTTFHIPEGFEVVVFMALGYLGSPEALEEPFKTREITPRSRKNITEFTFHGHLPEKMV
jgi:nitroreductase